MQKFLLVGLGNIGDKYHNTRHNIGFTILDELALQQNAVFESSNFGMIAKIKYKARPVILLKPDTYMNFSGKAIKYWLTKESIDLNNLLVITDDLNLPFGTIRIRKKGSDGGHNGLKSIQEELSTSVYPRLRFGIGDEFNKGNQIDFVLDKWSKEEEVKLSLRLKFSAEALLSFCFSGLNNTMNNFNGK
jgi:PTH1 family peptidyl-tRNA hydrolase